MRKRQSILEYWLWEPEMMRVFAAVSVAIPVLVALILVPFMGAKGLIALVFAIIGPGICLAYWAVGRKMAALRPSLDREEGVVAPGAVVRGAIQSPAIIVLGEKTIAFHPAVGEPSDVRIDAIEAARERRVFNGSVLFGKTCFDLKVPDQKRLAFAVPVTYAPDFREWLGPALENRR